MEEILGVVSGRDLSRRFYEQVVRPLILGIPHAAALLGEGSEVLGFDDEVSTDHDFGPRVQLFVAPDVDTTPIDVALRTLPVRFDGFPVVYPDRDRYDCRPHHQVEVTTARAFFVGRLGVDPAGGMALADWLLAPTQILASLTGGVILHDPLRPPAAATPPTRDRVDQPARPEPTERRPTVSSNLTSTGQPAARRQPRCVFCPVSNSVASTAKFSTSWNFPPINLASRAVPS
jgi:hypothetical protein